MFYLVDRNLIFLTALFSFIFLLWFPADSFINIESLRQNLKSGFYGSSGLTYEGSNGNVEVAKSGLNSQNIYKLRNDEFILISQYSYGEASSKKNTNNGNLHVRYAHRIISHMQWEILSQVEFNEFQSLSLRSLVGGGIRLGLLEGEFSSLFLGLGSFYENEKIEDDVDQNNWRGNLFISFRKIISEKFESIATLYYQPSYKRVNDYRLISHLGFEFTILKSLTWFNQFKYAFDSRPPLGIKKEDASISFGINYVYE